jgi:hypothetical protein
LLAVLGTAITGCASVQPVDHPCGVITDSLQNVNATTKAGNERLAIHFERGAMAGCWKRIGNLPILADPVVATPVGRQVNPVQVIAQPAAKVAKKPWWKVF